VIDICCSFLEATAWSGLALARRCWVIPVCRAMPFGVAEPRYALLVGLGVGFLHGILCLLGPLGPSRVLLCLLGPLGRTTDPVVRLQCLLCTAAGRSHLSGGPPVKAVHRVRPS